MQARACGSAYFRDPRFLEEGFLALATLTLKNARETLANIDVAPQEKRTALVALPAIPRTVGLVKKVGTRSPAVVISAAPG